MDDFRDRVHGFFQEVWDPCHVGGIPGAEEEYRAFEGAFVACARGGYFEDRAALVAFVEETEDAMGGNLTPGHVRTIVDGLAELMALDPHAAAVKRTDEA